MGNKVEEQSQEVNYTGKRRLYALWLATLLLTIVFFWQSYSLYSQFSSPDDLAIELGQKVLIDIATAEVKQHSSTAPAISNTLPNVENSVDEPHSNDDTLFIDDKTILPNGEKPAIVDDSDIPSSNTDVGPVGGDAEYIEQSAKFVVIVHGLGLDKRTIGRALKFPKRVGLSFSPYTSDIESVLTHVTTQGYDVLIDAPFQTSRYPVDDPGKFAILEQAPETRNVFRLRKSLGNFSGLSGILALPDEIVTRSPKAARVILEVLSKAGLSLIYQENSINKHVKIDARSVEASVVPHYYYIGATPSVSVIDQQLQEIPSRLEKDENVVVVVAPYPAVMSRLRWWLQKWQHDGVVLSPVNDVIIQ